MHFLECFWKDLTSRVGIVYDEHSLRHVIHVLLQIVNKHLTFFQKWKQTVVIFQNMYVQLYMRTKKLLFFSKLFTNDFFQNVNKQLTFSVCTYSAGHGLYAWSNTLVLFFYSIVIHKVFSWSIHFFQDLQTCPDINIAFKSM